MVPAATQHPSTLEVPSTASLTGSFSLLVIKGSTLMMPARYRLPRLIARFVQFAVDFSQPPSVRPSKNVVLMPMAVLLDFIPPCMSTDKLERVPSMEMPSGAIATDGVVKPAGPRQGGSGALRWSARRREGERGLGTEISPCACWSIPENAKWNSWRHGLKANTMPMPREGAAPELASIDTDMGPTVTAVGQWGWGGRRIMAAPVAVTTAGG